MLMHAYVILMVMSILVLSVMSEWSWLINLSIIILGPVTLDISIIFEKQAGAFVSTVVCIFLMVYFYSLKYLSEEVYLKRFLGILSAFVSSMGILILSGNLFSSLVGWDGLGVTSLFLILFYYSKSALKASTLTFLMNRVGDCFFIMALTHMMLLGENVISYTCSSFSWHLAFLLIMTSITKSAQIPFSTWLPAAMEAPTPVSALVHSSTLVTAGIFLLYRYSMIWVNSDWKSLLLILSLSTCFMAALSALVESDLKKLIALSTLSQLGFIMFSFSLGMLNQGFTHMLMHAYFKALLFMCAGMMIHSFKGTQCIMMMSMSGKQNPVLTTITSCSLASMMGLPYMSGFYSKDMIVDSLSSSNSPILLTVLLISSFVCTTLYSIRIIWYLLNSSSNWHSMSDWDLGMIKPMLPLAVVSFLGGSMVSWMFNELETYTDSSKVMILIFLLGSVTSYWLNGSVATSGFLEKKWNLSIMNPLLSDLFFQSSQVYKSSSDLLGIPEIFNKLIKVSLTLGSVMTEKTMVQYSSNLEFLMFLSMILLII